MPENRGSTGTCVYCGLELTRTGMARHLRGCTRRLELVTRADKKGGPARPILHLQARDAWSGMYWLNLEVDGTSTLDELDNYLRKIWLECCGHMSRFSIGGWDGDELPMDWKIAEVLQPGRELTHIYDFGSESATILRPIDGRKGKRTTRRPIALMARNSPPEHACVSCERAATLICLHCAQRGRLGTLCERHSRTHRHAPGDERQVPLANSPRTGMCEYTGPALPPY